MLTWDNLEGKLIKNRYLVQRTIGRGGAGKVYLAFDQLKNRKVAIKTMDPDATMSNHKERFDIEAKVLSKLNHSNIIKYYDNFEFDGVDMIVMEYVEGISLEDKMKKGYAIEEKEALKYTKQILSALSEVHSHKVFHRDLKTSNIHITVDGNAKLLDFGIAQATLDQDLTRQGSVIGTISYMAPEIIKSAHKKANERTDIYSLGIMLYQLLTEVKPFKANLKLSGSEKNNDLARKIVNDIPLPLTEIDKSISKETNYLVLKMIEKEPADRYQTTAAVLNDLEIALKHGGLEKMEGYYLEETKDFSMKKQILLITLITTIVLIILIVAIVLLIVL